VDGLRERMGRICQNLTRRNRNGGSRDRAFRLTTLLSFSRGCDSLSVGGGGLGGYGGGGSPVGIQVAKGPSLTGGVFPFGEFCHFPGVEVLLGKGLRVAI